MSLMDWLCVVVWSLDNFSIGSILTLLGILIYPFSSFRKQILVIELVFAFGALAVLVRSASNIIGTWIHSNCLPALFQILGGFMVVFSRLTAALLISAFAARRMWRVKRKHHEA